MMGHLIVDDGTVVSHIKHGDFIADVLVFGLRCKDCLREGPHLVIGLCQACQRIQERFSADDSSTSGCLCTVNQSLQSLPECLLRTFTSPEQTGPSYCRQKRLGAMEVKVSVDGIPRVVCGVTDKTTCQEVVLALAQAQGQPGRYTLREKFKDFERCMAPDEHLLETLERYGEQAREVQLTLLHNGPSFSDEMTSIFQYEHSCPLVCNLHFGSWCLQWFHKRSGP
uniref:Ras association domain-containing protein n=1 Tax=Amphiprion ocellaris TaxID=80972 RepID=A0AAQ5XJT9_AMPOC